MDSPGLLSLAQTKTLLETNFPRIVESIVLMWGHRELDIYLTRLAVDERGDRQGFPPEIISDLMFLSQLHNVAHPFEESGGQYVKGMRFDDGLAFR